MISYELQTLEDSFFAVEVTRDDVDDVIARWTGIPVASIMQEEAQQDIQSLVRHENAILLETGELSFEAYVMRKVALMSDFEKEARKLLGALSGRNNKMNAQVMLVEEIRRVRDALKVNSGFQMDSIRARMQEKFAASDDTPPFAGVQEEGTVCH